jgi:hypothetical protein
MKFVDTPASKCDQKKRPTPRQLREQLEEAKRQLRNKEKTEK